MEQLKSPNNPEANPPGTASVRDAAAAWLEQHGDYLFGYALSRADRPEVAEDLVQETLLAAMQTFAQFEGRASVRTWLTSILRHKLRDHWRRQGRARGRTDARASSETIVDEEALERFADSRFNRRGIWREKLRSWPGEADSPLEVLESEEFRRTLLECLEKLPPRPAEAIDLIERCGMNLEQLSNALGVTTTHAGVILHRARLTLRECLEMNWFRET